MHTDVITKISTDKKLPKWWVESIVVEYLDCRNYAVNNDIWEFDFSRINETDLIDALNTYNIIICRGILTQNYHKDSWFYRFPLIAGIGYTCPTCKSEDEIFPNGPVSDYHFIFEGNPLQTWDPKLSLSKKFQVYDQGKIWQWHFSDLLHVEGTNHEKYISNIVDLEPFNILSQKVNDLRNNIVLPGQDKYEEFKEKIINMYEEITIERRRIFSKLIQYHHEKVTNNDYIDKTINHIPPFISRHETITIQKNKCYAKIYAEAIFYNSCMGHINKINEIINGPENINKLDKKDLLIENSSIIIIMAAACIEALINGIGTEKSEVLWRDCKNLNIAAKFNLLYYIHAKSELLKWDIEPYQLVKKIFTSRNSLMHFKGSYDEVIVKSDQSSITKIEETLDLSLIQKIEINFKPLLIRIFSDLDYLMPIWLEKSP